MKIVLIGFMGTGKSSLGRLLARKLKFTFIDTDALIEERQGRSITEIFATDGEPFFRQLERDLALELSLVPRAVISTGGGFPLNPDNIQALRQDGFIVALTATPEMIYQRIKSETHRPLLAQADPLNRITALLKAREAVYQNSDLTLDTTARTLEAMAAEVIAEVRNRGVVDGED